MKKMKMKMEDGYWVVERDCKARLRFCLGQDTTNNISSFKSRSLSAEPLLPLAVAVPWSQVWERETPLRGGVQGSSRSRKPGEVENESVVAHTEN